MSWNEFRDFNCSWVTVMMTENLHQHVFFVLFEMKTFLCLIFIHESLQQSAHLKKQLLAVEAETQSNMFPSMESSYVVWREVTLSHSVLWRTALVFTYSWTSVSHLDWNTPTVLTGRNRGAADVMWLHGLMDSWRKAAVKMWGDEYNASLTQVTTLERGRERERMQWCLLVWIC